MKKFIIAALPILFLGACTKDITSLNENPKAPATVPATALFTQGQNTLASNLSSANVYLNIFRLIEQQWQETTYITESNYNIKDNKIPDGIWTAFYRDVLEPFEQAKANFASSPTLAAGTKKNSIAIADIMQVYSYYYLLTTFGNIPYTDALNIDNKFPKYDDAATVYNALLTRLDADIANLDEAEGSLDNADQVYGGDVASWRKFANTFKLKMGITMADVDNAKAKSVVEAAVAAGVFTSNADNANFKFATNPPNTNPVWVDLVQSGRLDFVAGKTFVDALTTSADPRIGLYFTKDAAGGYSGGKIGTKNSYDAFSKPSVALTAPNFPGLLLDYSETEFNLAEAVERGYNVGGTAATHYNNAITASILYWGGTQAAATAYIATPSVAYATATGDYKQKIGYQKWLALYNRGWDAWVENRRLDYPKLPAPANPVSDFPVRFNYPVSEQNVNTVNYNDAAAKIGGDEVTSKLFFDKN
ncbi:SusD/RagB family nutrient-binding outer membrane lipoprotein [Mucilaginibacter pallidiroseus]|uniref:SusD/RagB family nutrient-binding outer membrane lipoprotein n=1 Tax=Mucilaginibacter pallidiroseus TaxID=2599295 RepID=A0A563U0T9_9SPHI|nr:SusD/RagB family nutrient-binding outer membrane lipoprotein [Mucilaginibacter pallidiroseus]TWR25244.1 SusD/RagB family nutrient-binding outer membrane lipoprotein [Mucilaginibacter pallidiroseus]